ncbi:hypothetical protein [Spirillospora sp. NPDC029432]|uniref:DUF6933 domain-containing protein n=1 Tax=Spirillospora sp. NPDC029432 TaxID=3154599 RepID=UPI00345416B7
MLIVRATKKLRDRVGGQSLKEGDEPTTVLGQWYATALFWQPQVALLVNEPTLLPVLMPLAPAATLLIRFPDHLATVLAAHGVQETFINEEARRMKRGNRVGKTANRSVVGIMNEFSHLAEAYRGRTEAPDLLEMALRLAATPCSPLNRRHVSPDRELHAHLSRAQG